MWDEERFEKGRAEERSVSEIGQTVGCPKRYCNLVYFLFTFLVNSCKKRIKGVKIHKLLCKILACVMYFILFSDLVEEAQ